LDAKTHEEVHHFKDAHLDEITTLDIRFDSKFLVSGSLDECIKIFDLSTKQEIHHFKQVHECENIEFSRFLNSE